MSSGPRRSALWKGPEAELPGPSDQAVGTALRGGSGTDARLEHDDRGLPGTERRPAVVLVAELDPPSPEPITLVAFRSATTDVTHAVIQLDDGVRAAPEGSATTRDPPRPSRSSPT